MFAKIRAVSSYLPEIVEKNIDVVEERFSKKLGVVDRHIVAEDESAGDLAFKAAEKLFTEYDIDRNETDFILLCTQHPDYQMPHTSPHLQHRLGLSQTVGSMDIALGCSGYIYGLATSKGLIETGIAKKILFLTSSVYTKYINVKDTSVRPLFGDGATATWIEGVDEDAENIRAFVFGTDGSRYDRLYIPVGGSRLTPRSTPEVFEYDENKNYHSNYEVYMDGMAIAYFTLREVPKTVDRVLAAANITREDLDYCIFHQANEFMLGYVQKKAALENVPFHNTITHTGNLVSGSVPYAIEQVVTSVDVKNLHNVMLTGFGVGLSWAGCLVDLSGVFPKKVVDDAEN
ncbi:MAG: ketoacyl-ACP synthase III [Selenomonadaceae bacterium]|nr:ketoacyl-ACP synthase III [Selenomonadaceae bacterium]